MFTYWMDSLDLCLVSAYLLYSISKFPNVSEVSHSLHKTLEGRHIPWKMQIEM